MCKDGVSNQVEFVHRKWLSFTQTSCHMLCMDDASHQCEFIHETILFELLVTFFASKRFLFVTCFAWMRFLTSVSLFMRQYYLNFLSHSLQGWGSSPVSLFIRKDCPFPILLVTFFARIKFLTSMLVHEKRWPKLLFTFSARKEIPPQ